jgi:hypothetical protein
MRKILAVLLLIMVGVIISLIATQQIDLLSFCAGFTIFVAVDYAVNSLQFERIDVPLDN